MTREKGRRRLFPRFPVGEDVERELRAHLELCVDELVAAGWDPEEARIEAERRFGDPGRVGRQCRTISRQHERAVRRTAMMESLVQDIRYAMRVLVKSPGFSLVAILILALGIGANATVFSIVNGVLLSPLPYDDPEELVWVAERMESGGQNWVAWANYRDWREEAQSFQGLSAYNAWTATVLGGDRPAYAQLGVVSRDFWKVFPNTPVAGRLTGDEDHTDGAPPRGGGE
ncbi:permease prefix domain 1-containing protein [Gemmatimonadota bacterium]